MMKLLKRTNGKITKDENVPHLEIIEVLLVHCNIVNNNYQQNSKVLYTFFTNKSFGQLLFHQKTFNSEFSKFEIA